MKNAHLPRISLLTQIGGDINNFMFLCLPIKPKIGVKALLSKAIFKKFFGGHQSSEHEGAYISPPICCNGLISSK